MTPRLSDADLIQAEIIPVDEVMRASERKWGVGRLICLIEPAILARWKIGFDKWNAAIDSGDMQAVRELAPKIRQALAFMDKQATDAGHAPLVISSFETALEDGRVLCLVRTAAEASAAVQQAEGRHLVVWSMEELARVLPKLETLYVTKALFSGSRVEGLVPRDEMAPQRWVSNGRWNEIHQQDAAALRGYWQEPLTPGEERVREGVPA
nr:hypothetical protein [uncultured Lichenicoccus sp.]